MIRMCHAAVPRRPRGVVALLAVLMLSALLTAMVVAGSSEEMLEREDMNSAEAHASAERQSDICASFALNAITQSPDRVFIFPQIVYTDATHICSIDSIKISGANILITTHAETGGSSAFTTVHADRANSGVYEIASWKSR